MNFAFNAIHKESVLVRNILHTFLNHGVTKTLRKMNKTP